MTELDYQYEHDHLPGQDDISDQDVRDVLESMIDDGTLEPGSSAYGIAKLFSDTLDFDQLTEKQKFVFNRDIRPELIRRTREIATQRYIDRHPE